MLLDFFMRRMPVFEKQLMSRRRSATSRRCRTGSSDAGLCLIQQPAPAPAFTSKPESLKDGCADDDDNGVS
ncbi:uncharacterized [Tachysurus ichikawai]